MSEKACSVGACWRPVSARGWCQTHYERWRRAELARLGRDRLTEPGNYTPPPIRWLREGEVPTGEPRRYLASSGYVRLRWRMGDEYVECFEHRWVMGAKPGEQVHHINHDRSDNRPENLKLVTTAEHGAEHRAYDREEIVRLYLSGKTTLAIQAELGITAAQVSRILAAEGVPARRPLTLRTDIDREKVRDMLRAGVPMKRIARELGCSDGLVNRERRLLGLPSGRPGRPVGS